MAFCQNCGSQLSDGTVFCGKCGAKQETRTQNKTCPNCGAKAPMDMVFCDKCGARLTGAKNDEAVKQDLPSAPLPMPPSEITVLHKPWESAALWCSLSVGALSYLVQAFWYHPQGMKGLYPNFLLVLLFALQTPCFLLAFTGFLHRWFRKKDWTIKPGFRRGLLLAIACIGSILTYFIAYQGERITMERLILARESSGMLAAFLTLQLIGIICASLALALGETDGRLGWKGIGVVVAVVFLFSLISYLYTHTSVVWTFLRPMQRINPNRFIAPCQLAGMFVIAWKLFRENFPLLCTHLALPKAAFVTMIASAAVLIIGTAKVTDFVVRLTRGAAFELYMEHKFYDPVLLPLGLLLMALSTFLWFLGSKKTNRQNVSEI